MAHLQFWWRTRAVSSKEILNHCWQALEFSMRWFHQRRTGGCRWRRGMERSSRFCSWRSWRSSPFWAWDSYRWQSLQQRRPGTARLECLVSRQRSWSSAGYFNADEPHGGFGGTIPLSTRKTDVNRGLFLQGKPDPQSGFRCLSMDGGKWCLEEGCWISSPTSKVGASDWGSPGDFLGASSPSTWTCPTPTRQHFLAWSRSGGRHRTKGGIHQKSLDSIYKNKLKGVPLEFVRLAVAELHTATQITKEALKELADQLDAGRVNAEVPEDSSSSSSSSEEEKSAKEKGSKGQVGAKETSKAKQGTQEKTGQARLPGQVRVPDPRYPVMEMSDEEDEGAQPISNEQVRAASSALDDVPISIHQRQVPTSSAAASSSRPMASTRPRKKAKTHGGSRGDPSTRPCLERRGMFDKAMHRTELHFRAMRQKLEPKTVQIAVPTQQTDQEMIEVQVKTDDPPYINLMRIWWRHWNDQSTRTCCNTCQWRRHSIWGDDLEVIQRKKDGPYCVIGQFIWEYKSGKGKST